MRGVENVEKSKLKIWYPASADCFQIFVLMHHRPKTGELRFLVGKSSYCSACNQDCIKPAQYEFDMYLSSPTLQQKARASLDQCPSTKSDVASLSAVTQQMS